MSHAPLLSRPWDGQRKEQIMLRWLLRRRIAAFGRAYDYDVS
jgi:hypothetical protein